VDFGLLKASKILVIRFSSLGDVILTTPLLKILKQNYPGARIDYCTKAACSEVLQFNPNVDRLIPIDDNLDFNGLKNLKRLIRDNSYDLIIDAHNNLRTFYLRRFIGTKTLKFKKYSLRKFLLVNFKINLMKNLPPIIERYIGTVSPLLRGVDLPDFKSVKGRGVLPEIYTDDSSKQKVDNLFKELNVPAALKLICIIPSAKHFTKIYPPEYYAEIINKSENCSFLLAGKGTDKKNIDIIKSKTGSNVYDLCDKLSVLQLAEVMKKCSLVISGDTGPMHIAEALNIPLNMIAGSSVKEFGFYPQSQNSTVIENNGLACRPCSHIGRSECPLTHFKCMRELKPIEISAKAEIS